MADAAEPGEPQEPVPGAQSAAGSARVFISYASQDKAVADALCQALEQAGVECWIAPRDVTPGVFYADAIVQAINAAQVLLVVLSVNSVNSQHVLREVERASAKRRPLVAFRLDTTPLPTGLEYFLSASHWLDASKGSVEHALSELVTAINRLLASAATPAADVIPPPDGVSGAREDRNTVRKPGHKRILVGVLAAALLLTLLISGYWLSNRSTPKTSAVPAVSRTPATVPATPGIPEKSVAVLPFTDMSEKKDQEYFADGMAEEIIGRLVQVPELRVPARASSFYFKGKSTKISEIARDLNVAQVLEGSVRKSGSRLRVTVQLVRADTGYQVWSETYDRELQDVFKVQGEIATSVAGALQVSLLGGPLKREIGGTHSIEAYELYLKARRANFEGSQSSVKAGASLVQRALKIDPQFGLAWSLFALILVAESDLEIASIQDGYGHGRRLAEHAIEVSPGLAEPHAVLAYVYRSYNWDWPAAAKEIHQALDINRRDVLALTVAGTLAQTLGQWDEALQYQRAALVEDPFSTYGYINLGITLYLAGRYRESESAFRRLLEIDPSFSNTKKYLAKALLAEGKNAEALKVLESMEPGPFRLQYLPAVLLANGRKADAEAALQQLIEKYPDTFTYSIAMNFAYLNERDRAMQWLEHAYLLKDNALIEIVGEPLFSNLSDDPRFKAFLHKMQLSD